MKNVDYNKVAEILIRGRARIQQGWISGHYKQGANYCAIGAIRYDLLEHDRVTRISARQFLEAALHGRKDFYGNIEAYNDSPGTTKEDILRMYDNAIALAQEQCEGEPLPPMEVDHIAA